MYKGFWIFLASAMAVLCVRELTLGGTELDALSAVVSSGASFVVTFAVATLLRSWQTIIWGDLPDDDGNWIAALGRFKFYGAGVLVMATGFVVVPLTGLTRFIDSFATFSVIGMVALTFILSSYFFVAATVVTDQTAYDA